MNIGKAKVAYPYILYKVQVTHHTERKSTALEWMLLEIAHTVEKHKEYASVQLEKILTDLFSITDSDLLLRGVLLDLIDVNALEFISGFNDNSDWSLLRCDDLKLTDKGRQLQEEGKLPAKKRNNNLDIVYDLNGNSVQLLSSNDNKLLLSDTPNIQLSDLSENNLPGFPSNLISDLIKKIQQNGKNSPAWLQRDSQIDHISATETPSLKWKNESLDIYVDDAGNFEVKDEPNKEIAERILSSLDFSLILDNLPSIDINSLKTKRNFQQLSNLTGNVESAIQKNKIFLLNPQLLELTENLKNKIIIVFGNDTFNIKELNKNIIVSIPSQCPAGFCYQDLEKVILAATIEIHLGKTSRSAPYFFEESSDFSSIIDKLIRENYREHRNLLKLLDYVPDVSYSSFYTKEYLIKLLNSQSIDIVTPVDKIIEKLYKLDAEITTFLPDLQTPSSSEQIRRLIIEKKGDTLKEVHELITQWREACKKIKEITNVDLTELKWGSSPFGISLNRVDEIADAINVFFDDSLSLYSKVFVIDTCSLMKNPKILDYFSNNKAMVIIPKMVLMELEKHKGSTDETAKSEARAASKKIDEYKDKKWLNLKEDSELSLLSKDYQKKPKNDFHILSVALKYKVKEPVLVTDDINLRNIAKSEGVNPISSSEFIAKTKFPSKQKRK